MTLRRLIITQFVLMAALLASAVPIAVQAGEDGAMDAAAIRAKFRFDLDRVDRVGERGITYEFCIPDTPAARERVLAINPKLSFQGSPGRIGCSRDELLSIGETFGPGPHRPTLEALGALPFMKAFGLTWFE